MKDLISVDQGKATTVQVRQENASQKNEQYVTYEQNNALSCTITRPVEIRQYWTVPRQTQRITTPSFAKKSGGCSTTTEKKKKKKESYLDSTASQQDWSKQVERM